MRLAYCPYYLDFIEPAGTSRGVMNRKLTCFIKIYDEKNPEVYGIGEAALFEGLSPESGRLYEYKLLELLANVALGVQTDLSRFPSIQYGFEQALNDYVNGCKGIYFPSGFTKGDFDIEINGLVWMGDFDKMIERIDSKVDQGFKCIKLKIGAIEWDKELDMIRHIRDKYNEKDLTIRVDANGGFNMDNALPRLKRLADMGVHSIEQPIPAGNQQLMGFLCQVSPLPIALDEELIGQYTTADKAQTLDMISPAYIILKPALCGGFDGTMEWIQLARRRGIGWWITSSLESNVGLNALAQFTSQFNRHIPQGLGTGLLFKNNFSSPIYLEGNHLKYNPNITPDYSQFDKLQWRD